jgi:hypothetical protein
MSENRDESFMVVGALRAAHSMLQISGGPRCPQAREAWHEAIRFCNKALLREWEYAATVPSDAGESK